MAFNETKVVSVHEKNVTHIHGRWTVDSVPSVFQIIPNYTSETFSIATDKKYDFRLEIGTFLDSPIQQFPSTDFRELSLRMSPISEMNNELKDWEVNFSILDIPDKGIHWKVASYDGKSWICRNFISVVSVRSTVQRQPLPCTNLTVVWKIVIRPKRINFNVPKFQEVRDDRPLDETERFFDELARLFDEKLLTDVTLNICGAKLRVHKLILSARSSVFSAMFEHDMLEKELNEVDITDIDLDVFTEMLRFMYTGNAPNIMNKTGELLAAADKYNLERLKAMCEERLYESFEVNNVADVLKIADLHSVTDLKTKAIDFINSHATDVIETAGYKSMVHSHPHLIDELYRASAMKTNEAIEAQPSSPPGAD